MQKAETPSAQRCRVKQSPRVNSSIRKEPSFRSIGRVLTKENCPNIDKEIQRKLKVAKLSGRLKKCEGNVYAYGNNTVMIDVKQNRLVCKVGGGFQTFDEFVENCLAKQRELSSERQSFRDLAKKTRSPPLEDRGYHTVRKSNHSVSNLECSWSEK